MSPVSLFTIAIFLNDETGEATHDGITIALRDNQAIKDTLQQVFVKQVIIEKFYQIHAAGIQRYLGSSAKEELCCIQSLHIEYGKMELTSSFIALYKVASLQYSIGNSTWNLGLAVLTFFSRS